MYEQEYLILLMNKTNDEVSDKHSHQSSLVRFFTLPSIVVMDSWLLVRTALDLMALVRLGAHADALAVVRPTGAFLMGFVYSGTQFYVLLSPYLCFISFLYLDLYVFGDDALIS